MHIPKHIDPLAILKLEAARGLARKGERPALAQYNAAVTPNQTGKQELLGSPLKSVYFIGRQ